MDNKEIRVEIFTDGACSGNPGAGGWGAVLRWRDAERELKGGESETTNNRMELMAAIKALESLDRPVKVDLYTDSTYVQKGITEWIHSWKRRGWKTASRTPVKNEDLWRRLDNAVQHQDVSWHWIKGHAGHEGNERADALARAGLSEAN